MSDASKFVKVHDVFLLILKCFYTDIIMIYMCVRVKYWHNTICNKMLLWVVDGVW